MEGQIDSHQWVSKIETHCLLAGKPDLEIEAHTQTANDEPNLPVKPLPARIGSFFKRAVAEHLCT